MDGEKLIFQQNTEHLGETQKRLLSFQIPYETLSGALNHFISLRCQTPHKRGEVNWNGKAFYAIGFFIVSALQWLPKFTIFNL